MRVASFNLQNMRLRVRNGQPVLDGAVDHDDKNIRRSTDLDIADRRETAKVIEAARADVAALQEVFDLDTLDYFHDHFLLPAGARAYPFRYCFAGNDGRGLNVAAMCLKPPISVKSHADLTGKALGLLDLPRGLRDRRLFRRDCLQLDFERVTLFVCHFKAPYPDARKAEEIRRAEARAVRKLVEKRFEQPANERWMILGDLNEPATVAEAAGSALGPLQQGFSVDLLDRLPAGTDWTYEVPETHLHSRPDRIFVSPRLAQEYPDARPGIIRSGMDHRQVDTGTGERGNATRNLSHASDHALVYADFPGL